MTPLIRYFALILVLCFSLDTYAKEPSATSTLHVVCDGDNVGAEISINKNFKGECPIDIKVPAGSLMLTAVKNERVFKQKIRIGEGVTKNVDVILSNGVKDDSPVASNPSKSTPKEANSVIRVSCDEYGTGGDVMIDGQLKGQCPVDLKITEGTHKLQVVKTDGKKEFSFVKDLVIGADSLQKINAEMSLAITNDKGCKIAQPGYKSGEEITWTGSCENGKLKGVGKYTTDNHSNIWRRRLAIEGEANDDGYFFGKQKIEITCGKRNCFFEGEVNEGGAAHGVETCHAPEEMKTTLEGEFNSKIYNEAFKCGLILEGKGKKTEYSESYDKTYFDEGTFKDGVLYDGVDFNGYKYFHKKNGKYLD